MNSLTVAAEDSETVLFGTSVSDIQTNISISGMRATGTLKYLNTGAIADHWGAGNFIALKFSAGNWSDYSSVKVGLEPSQGSGLAELINDPDKNGVFKVTNKDMQRIKIMLGKGSETSVQYLDLSGLVCEGG